MEVNDICICRHVNIFISVGRLNTAVLLTLYNRFHLKKRSSLRLIWPNFCYGKPRTISCRQMTWPVSFTGLFKSKNTTASASERYMYRVAWRRFRRVMTPWSLEDGYQRFEGTYWLHLPIFTIVKFWDSIVLVAGDRNSRGLLYFCTEPLYLSRCNDGLRTGRPEFDSRQK
jgi:hypothetical protein